MDVQWIKLMTDMFDNRKIRYLRRLPDGNSIVLIWVMLLSLAGRCNAGGMIFLTENIPYTPKMLADELDFEENTVSLALTALENLGMISTNPLEITNWEEYQNVEGMEKVKEQNRLRKRKQRALEAKSRDSHVTVTDNVTQCHATDIEEELEEELEKEVESIETSDDVSCRSEDRQAVVSAWNALGLSQITKLIPGTNRYKQINARIKEYGLDKVLEAIDNVRQSSFLRGQNKNGWIAAFDWLIKPNNFCKVLDGNYANHEAKGDRQVRESSVDRLKRMMEEGVFGE